MIALAGRTMPFTTGRPLPPSVRCGTRCQQNAWLDLRKVRRPPETWIWALEGSLACSVCRERVRFPPRTKIECLCQYDKQFGARRHDERD